MLRDIWDKFDTDRSGYLDESETRRFVKHVLYDGGDREFNEREFQQLYAEFDYRKNGRITKEAMRGFIKRVVAKDNKKMNRDNFRVFKSACDMAMGRVENYSLGRFQTEEALHEKFLLEFGELVRTL